MEEEIMQVISELDKDGLRYFVTLLQHIDFEDLAQWSKILKEQGEGAANDFLDKILDRPMPDRPICL